MKKNLSKTDRIVRIVIGLAVIVWGFYAKNWLGLVGVALLGTGAIGYCGLYQLLGIATLKAEIKANETQPSAPASSPR